MTCPANVAVGVEPAPKNPSPSRTARRSAAGPLAPIQTGGCGFWAGLGSIAAPCSCQNSPSKVTRGSVHSAFISSRPSVNRATYRCGSTPNAANGRPGPPVPTPISVRPWLSWSSVLRLLARCTGLYRVDTNTTQPSRSRSVHAAA